jgi:2'-5' RNA ligase
MAFLGIKVPHEIGDLLAQVDVPDEREPKDKYHITILNLGDEVPIEALGRAAIAAFNVTSYSKPFQVRCGLVSAFEGAKSGVPIIARIESPELHQLWSRLKLAFDTAGVEYSKKFPEYVPHVTLAYAQETMPDKVIQPLTWTVSQIVLWGGDKGANRIIVQFPLEISKDIAASVRVAARYQYACAGGCGCACQCNKETATEATP